MIQIALHNYFPLFRRGLILSKNQGSSFSDSTAKLLAKEKIELFGARLPFPKVKVGILSGRLPQLPLGN